jgi:hypothetical protein
VLEACSVSFARSIGSLREGGWATGAWDGNFGACMSAAMLCESSKDNARLSSVYAKGIGEFLDILTEEYGDRDRAAAALSCFVGAWVMARAVQLADRELADQFMPLTTDGRFSRESTPAAGPRATY